MAHQTTSGETTGVAVFGADDEPKRNQLLAINQS
jgi:hypothetical protein